MKVSFQALSRHLDLAGVTAERVAEVLPMLGLEVESVTTFGLAPLPLVVVGEIKSFEKHPKADRLSVCQVDAGEGSLRQIVCGAKNFKAGDRVLFGKWSGTEVTVDGEELLIMKESDILGIIA